MVKFNKIGCPQKAVNGSVLYEYKQRTALGGFEKITVFLLDNEMTEKPLSSGQEWFPPAYDQPDSEKYVF